MNYYKLRPQNPGIDGGRLQFLPSVRCPVCGVWKNPCTLNVSLSDGVADYLMKFRSKPVEWDKYQVFIEGLRKVDASWYDAMATQGNLIPGNSFAPCAVIGKTKWDMFGFVGCLVVSDSLRHKLDQSKLRGFSFIKIGSVDRKESIWELFIDLNSDEKSRPIKNIIVCPKCGRHWNEYLNVSEIYSDSIPSGDIFRLHDTYAPIISENLLSFFSSICDPKCFKVENFEIIKRL